MYVYGVIGVQPGRIKVITEKRESESRADEEGHYESVDGRGEILWETGRSA